MHGHRHYRQLELELELWLPLLGAIVAPPSDRRSQVWTGPNGRRTFEHSLSENDEFLDDVLPRDSDLESEDLVWDVEGLVVDLLTKLGHNEAILPRTISSGGAIICCQPGIHDHRRKHVGSERGVSVR